MAKLDKVFKAAADLKASDVHVAPGEPFILRRLGRLRKLKSPAQSPEACRQLIFELLDEAQQKKLMADSQLDFAYAVPELGRLRGSAMMHQKGLSAAFRLIPPEIPTLESLEMPEVVRKVLDYHQGLILVTGGTGHGKTTTLAAMVDYINETRDGHIITNEILIGSPALASMIREGKISQISSLIQTGTAAGMQSMDQHLKRLVAEGRISKAAAYEKAMDKTSFS